MCELQTKEPGLDYGGDWKFESRRDALTGARLLMDFFAPDEGYGVRILLSPPDPGEADCIVAEWEPGLGETGREIWTGGAA